MFLTLQFPLGDLRAFAGSDDRLPYPSWPVPRHTEHLRSAGGIRKRIRTGLKNWIGESQYCAADHALKFSSDRAQFSLGNGASLQACFRRFFFDGQAAGKFEVGFRVTSSNGSLAIGRKDFDGLLNTLFTHPVRIPGQNSDRTLPLIRAGKALAALYQSSSSAGPAGGQPSLHKHLVKAGAPLLFVEIGNGESVAHRFRAAHIAGLDNSKVSLAHIWLNKASLCDDAVRCWMMTASDSRCDYARELRISLLRLNASRVGLETVVNGLTAKTIAPERGTEASERLQHYLNHHAERCIKVPPEYDDSGLLGAACQSEHGVTSDSVITLLDTLKHEVSIRRQILSKTERVVELLAVLNRNSVIHKQEIVMGDHYEAGQVGAQGPNAHAHDMSFNQVLLKNSNGVDLQKLGDELRQLRDALAASAATPEHYVEMGVIASAEMEATNGHGEKSLAALAKAGKWSLGVAEKIGVGLVTAVLKTSLGL